MAQTEIRQSRESRGKLATAQQRKASNPEKSVWVQASAGTGKTKVLSDRVLRILLNGCPPGADFVSDLYQSGGGGNEPAHFGAAERLGRNRYPKA